MYESNEVIDQLPKHLLDLIIDQPYNAYSPQDHAVWRYVMRRNVKYLSQVAHHSYVGGLKRTGVDIDSIPQMYGMNRILRSIGWAAVTVDGFIPPSAFMEFQAYNVLVIAADIRPIDQIEYTPAPDIIHEAAGHAPIISDPDYAEYLRLFGEIGHRAFSSRQDYALYEAIRHLSILKADPYTKPEAILGAEKELALMEKDMGPPSEMALIRNLHWWTVEYGLIGDLKNPKIYGAGLLSSIGESFSCLKPEVKKLPYSLQAKDYSFDITTRQPQLFVTPDFEHLSTVLGEFADTMAIHRGGSEGVRKAIDSGNTATCVFSSGIQVSGIFSCLYEDEGKPAYIKTDGPTQLAYADTRIKGHGKEHHPNGYGSPIGLLAGQRQPLRMMTDIELQSIGIVNGKSCLLEFQSGVRVEGILQEIIRKQGEVILLSFARCTVNYKDEVMFMPGWGQYDLAVGEEIISAYSGVADPDAYEHSFPVPAEKTHKIQHDERSRKLHVIYQDVRDIRESGAVVNPEPLRLKWQSLCEEYPEEWLLHLEMLELLYRSGKAKDGLALDIMSYLRKLQEDDPSRHGLISNGLSMLSEA